MKGRKMKRWGRLLLGLIALALTPALHAANPCTTGGAPVMRDGSGAGGTGLRPEGIDGSGQGGTGISPHGAGGDGSGTGGTGHTVQVEGVITGFASICVNGLELHYQPTTPVTIHGRTASPGDLEVGQVVRALATGQGAQLTVQQVHVRHLLVGQVQAIGPGGLQAQGRNIGLSPGTVLPAGLAPGVKVAVSGFAGANGHSVATRLDVVPDDTPDSLTGEVRRAARGQLTVDGVVLDGRLPRLAPGDIVHAEGRYTGGRMQVTRFEREERIVPVDRVVIQGLVRRADKSGLDIGGQRFLVDTRTRGRQARAGDWAIVDAVREGGQLRVRELEEQAHPGSLVNRPDQGEGDDSHREDASGKKPFEQKAAPHADTDSGRTDRDTRDSGHDDDREQEHETERSEAPESPERIERPETAEPERPERTEMPEKAERHETIERPEAGERPELERPQKIERPERAEKPERVERVERVERPEREERPERVERPEREERVERVEHHEHDD
jgi:hypothetical protein